jgi:hypothetical protein
VSAVDENGKYQVDELGYGDIWYFPRGQAHTIHGLDDENEYLLAFDDGDFDKVGCVISSADVAFALAPELTHQQYDLQHRRLDRKNPQIHPSQELWRSRVRL